MMPCYTSVTLPSVPCQSVQQGSLLHVGQQQLYAIIEHVKKHCGAAEIQLTYFYFDYNDSQKEAIYGVLRSMILQLCTIIGKGKDSEKLPSVVESLFVQCNEGLQQLSLQNLIDTS